MCGVKDPPALGERNVVCWGFSRRLFMNASAKVRYTSTTCKSLRSLLPQSDAQRSTLLLNTKACLKVL